MVRKMLKSAAKIAGVALVAWPLGFTGEALALSTATIDFDSGTYGGSENQPYLQDGFVIGPVLDDNSQANCPGNPATPRCAKISHGGPSNFVTLKRQDGLLFSLESLAFKPVNRNNGGFTANAIAAGQTVGTVEFSSSTPNVVDDIYTFDQQIDGFHLIERVEFSYGTLASSINNGVNRIDNLVVAPDPANPIGAPVPEIDASAGMGSLAALGAVLAFLRARRRHS